MSLKIDLTLVLRGIEEVRKQLTTTQMALADLQSKVVMESAWAEEDKAKEKLI